MITRISSNPALNFVVVPLDSAVYCVVSGETPRLHLKSEPLLVTTTISWDIETMGRLTRFREFARNYDVEDVSEISSSCPSPPDNESRRASDGKFYCQQWDAYYVSSGRYAVLKQQLLEHRRVQLQRLVEESVRLNSLLSQSQDVIALLESPIPMNTDSPSEGRFYALFSGSIWAASRELEAKHWRILVNKYLEKEEARFAVAVGVAEPSAERERISSDVRRAVWIRDQGKCVRCGNRERLEFDHIVPVSRGGSNTERNIELLCEVCNRAKSDSIM